MRFDYLYNNFKILKQEVKRTITSSSSLGSQSMDFLLTYGSTNEVDTVTIQVSTISTPVSTVSAYDNIANLSDATVYAFLANQPNGSQLRTGKKITINGSDTAGYDKTKVECFNCHKMGHFARECRSPRSQESRPRNQDSSRKTVIIEDTSFKVMVAIDGAGFDWSYMVDDEVPNNMALMAFSDSEVHNRKRLFAPPTIDLSSFGLEEFKQPEFESYGPKASKSVYVDTSNVIKKASDALIIEDWVSDCDEDESKEMTKIHVDNESVICVVKNLVYHSKTKHIEIRLHFIRHSYEKRLIEIVKIHTDSNVLDLLTTAFNVTSGLYILDTWNEVQKWSSDENGIELKGYLLNDGYADLTSVPPNLRADEAINQEEGDRVERAIITDASLEAAQDSGCPKRQETMGGTSAKTRSERVLEQPNKPPLTEGHTSGSYTLRSNEGRIILAELMETCTTLSNRVTQLENELSTTKSVYNKAFITLTNKVKKLESQLKQKRSSSVIHSSDKEGPSVHIEDSLKQGRIIKVMDKGKNFDLVSVQGEVQETAEHSRDDDDEILVETLLNIKKSLAKDKGKGIMQEIELPKKLKKKEMIQLSLDEELA
nr:putative ribonuclease H-like domain-containing protein [Tanacetum cinerariifolium]